MCRAQLCTWLAIYVPRGTGHSQCAAQVGLWWGAGSGENIML